MVIETSPLSDADRQRAPQLPVTYYTNGRKMLLPALACFVFAVLFYWMLVDPWVSDPHPLKSKIYAYFGIIFFGAGVIVCICFLVRRWRFVTLDKTGILIQGYRRPISWSEIVNVDLVHQGAGSQEIEWIGIFVRDTSAYYASLGPIGRRLTSMTDRKLGTPFLINCAFLPIEPDILIAWLNEYRAKYSR